MFFTLFDFNKSLIAGLVVKSIGLLHKNRQLNHKYYYTNIIKQINKKHDFLH